MLHGDHHIDIHSASEKIPGAIEVEDERVKVYVITLTSPGHLQCAYYPPLYGPKFTRECVDYVSRKACQWGNMPVMLYT